MSADQERSQSFAGLHAGVTDRVIKSFYEVYNELGGGFLEAVYHRAFAIVLRQNGLTVEVEVPVPVSFRGEIIGEYRADLIVNRTVLLELKAVSALDRNHESQVLHYLRATEFEVGMLLNFGPKPQFKRMVLENGNKAIRVYPRESAVDFDGGAT